MKRKLTVAVCASLLTLSLVGCSTTKEETPEAEAPRTEATDSNEEAKLQDGTYEAETKEADDNGGKARAKIVVVDGKITEATYNEFNDDGDKRENEEYNKMMKEQAGVSPSEYEVKIEEQVIEAQSFEIDGVTGATSSSAKAKSLFEAVLKNAAEGKTEKALI